ncbi:FAD-dependent tricarballylate dehydrogenase TcuA [Pseudomonas nitroreducens]|uniref:FAD-dependent tricarballylate dehydrogenase TcuA n=1 Tax=Pseudomonas TaxID=286 RepID=UPI0007EE6213|nr:MULTISPECIES: FAD-dependent tricarballylate dehydrogenase TcuA [Pseudomonas]MDG9856050.1 FAD-dependent tricarballylate dehydrogenase TcuA [Pseudomonas nitroreducens]MDH1075212.1 FAD-dependent tricarballylate dehydrogenase TcuA [Pseudomonas nitroreducens]NMZ75668.1 FAD-dependent tricarballylate dehydrogenase TcuA [Pseudomonas nitroreducens]OBY48854.1 tricarballylate dehydrogenase [Pseudomonas sp. AU12215]
MIDVLVIGGGNAALCAALMAREAGASVLLLEGAPRVWRGGNSQHTRNLRCMHDAPQDVLVEAYPEEEYWQDLLKVTGGLTNEKLARITIRASSSCRDWMRSHGVHFQPPLSGALHVARTNAFFMGGGKALVNAYFRSAERLGVQIRYNAQVTDIELQDGRFVAACLAEREVDGQRLPAERIQARACVLAAGGFESNREWLREAWGQNERGEWPSDNFLIRGTRFNTGILLRRMGELGADVIGDPTQAHMVAIDARAPLYDGGICTRIDCVSLGVVVNRDGQRFYDEGEDFWPKRYAIWGRLVAGQPGQQAYSIIDQQAIGRFMPPVFPSTTAMTLGELARKLGLPEMAFLKTIDDYNNACQPGTFDHTALDDCHTQGLTPAKTHWARPLVKAPFYAYPLRPGVTFTYLGLATDETAAVHFDGKPSPNLFVAGEMMAGNVLGKGYTAGIGMAIGTAFGRIAGVQAAASAVAGNTKNTSEARRATV